ncbi:MAG: ABC transporter permease [Treponematales bacterium]
MKSGWIGFVASRYVSSGRKKSPSTAFSVLGIATGALALVVILSVMNGFQLGFIESILEMSSCHLRVDNLPSDETGAEIERRVLALPGVVSAMPFREISGLIRGKAESPRGVAARGVPADALERDGGLKSRLVIESGAFDLASPSALVLGAELARFLGVKVGDEVSLLSITGNLASGLNVGEGGSPAFRVAGIFRCGYYEYDIGWAYLNIDKAAELAGENQRGSLGVKLKDRWKDGQALAAVKRALAGMGLADSVRASSWREYNRSFFGALRTEKLMMFILVGLIFVVVALNIFQAQRRAVLERREEIGLLRALGASDLAVRLIFAWDGFVIGFLGAALGMAAGLLAAFHIPAVFSFLEALVNFFIHLINGIAAFFGAGGAGDFAIFSTQVFYLKEIPSRVIPREAALIFVSGLLSALLAAWFASGKISRTKPAEVLRYE